MAIFALRGSCLTSEDAPETQTVCSPNWLRATYAGSRLTNGDLLPPTPPFLFGELLIELLTIWPGIFLRGECDLP